MSTTVLESPPAAAPPALPEHDIRTWVDPVPCPVPDHVLGKPEDFRRWLEGMPQARACGRQHKSTACPLAEYLRARYGAAGDPCVTTYHYYVRERQHPMPRWAQLFVICIDLPGATTHRGGALNAGQALRFLDQALAEEKRQAEEGV